MANKRNSSVNEGIQGNVQGQAIAVGKGAKAVVNQSPMPDALSKVFDKLEKKVAGLPEGPEKVVASNAVVALKSEAKLGDKAKEETVSKWINLLAQMAPDIWDVAVATFANPVAGLGLTFSKVAKRAKDEKEKGKS
jgi:hypothetical protein